MSGSIQFKCPQCGQPGRVNAELHGTQWRCQRCGVRFDIGSAPPAQPDGIVVVCKCGKRFRAERKHEGRQAKCPACGEPLVIREAVAPTEAPASPSRPEPPAEPRSRVPLLVGAGVALTLLVAGSAFFLGRSTRTTAAPPTPRTTTAKRVADGPARAAFPPASRPASTVARQVVLESPPATAPAVPEASAEHAESAPSHDTLADTLAPASPETSPAPPDSAPAEAIVAEQRGLPEISKSLAVEFTSLVDAGKLEDAHRVLELAQQDLRRFASATHVPLWDNSIAPLLRLADNKRALLAKKGYLEASASSDGRAQAATQPGGRLTPPQNRELTAIRASLNKVGALVHDNKLASAQSEIAGAQKRLQTLVESSGIPEWSLAVAPVYQLAATRQTELDAGRDAEESRVAAQAKADTLKPEAATPAKPGQLGVGQVAPSFTATTLQGRQFSLQQLKGKWVLIDFWATWCGPCKAEMPNLKDIYATFGKDKRFVMMSLSIDNQIGDPLRYATENGLGWVQGFLGQGWNSPVLKAYGVHGIPAIFLVGPDGKIAATGIRGARIKTTVAQALGRN